MSNGRQNNLEQRISCNTALTKIYRLQTALATQSADAVEIYLAVAEEQISLAAYFNGTTLAEDVTHSTKDLLSALEIAYVKELERLHKEA
jgi:hypothetical protein